MRNYEISLWTLQDSFITVLEFPKDKSKGKTQSPTMTLNIDGTQTLTFSVPMYYYDNGEKRYNAKWYDDIGGHVIVNTRKVKVIFNKKTLNEEVYEFVIDKVTERHESDQAYCDVECSGLAFYELGKIGYKISLSSEDFYADDLAWFQGAQTTTQPIANINYWLDHFLKPIAQKTSTDSINTWYYDVQMDWSHLSSQPLLSRSADKIYEKDNAYSAYICAQTDIAHTDRDFLYETNTVDYYEKARMVDLEESNIYNLTQDIAEIFGVYCKYEYSYDASYHITQRKVVFYNSFLYENEIKSITYRANTNSIRREIDSTDLVTKMYIRTVEDGDNTISIIDVAKNYTKEDYLLNFDYLHKIGTITDESYSYVSDYEDAMHSYNTQLKPILNEIEEIQNRIPEVEAKKANAETASQLDIDRVNELNRLLESITDYTGEIPITEANPDSAVLHADEDRPGTYYIRINRQGVIFSTVNIYRTFQSVSPRLKDSVSNFLPVYDDDGNLIRINNIPASTSSSNKVFLTYSYNPDLYNKSVQKAWIARYAKDYHEAIAYGFELDLLEATLTLREQARDALLAQKEAAMKKFEQRMGPALREGYWQPEDYTDYGEVHTGKYIVTNQVDTVLGKTGYDSFYWDTNLSETEQDIKFLNGIEQNAVYYPCIDLSSIWDAIKSRLNSLHFIFKDTTLSASNNTKSYSLGAQALLVFIAHNNEVFPALILTGNEVLDETLMTTIKSQSPYLGYYTSTSKSDGTINYTPNRVASISNDMWLMLDSTYYAAYPRIKIESLALKNSEDQLALKYDSQNLTNFTDYIVSTDSVTSSYVSSSTVPSYLITIKPEVFMAQQFDKSLSILFTLSNADSAIYRDAEEIMKENSVPKVSYEVQFNIFRGDETLTHPSRYLNHVVNINDHELHFEDVRGYISALTLNLDHPWQDQIEIKNYKTKFEDLFSKIVAQTEAMQKNEYLTDAMSTTFTSGGLIEPQAIEKSMELGNINYSFNDGTLTLDNENGLWGASDKGVVAFRGGGLFTASKKDANGDWMWSPAITPEGLQLNYSSMGQLDLSKIKIFSGDKIRFQMNEDGLFAYKSLLSEYDRFKAANTSFDRNQRDLIIDAINAGDDIEGAQYVKFNEEGLFLIAKPGARIFKDNEYITLGEIEGSFDPPLDASNELKRVSISWDGLTLRNYHNRVVFYADADTGNLTLEGTIKATGGNIGSWMIGNKCIFRNYGGDGEIEFGNPNGIYFGENGLSLFGLFNVQVGDVMYGNTAVRRFQEFIIKNSDKDDDYMLRISLDHATNRYEFNLKQVVFGDDVRTSLESINISRIKRRFFVEPSVLVQEDVEAGDLILFYTPRFISGTQSSNVNITLYNGSSSSDFTAVADIINVHYWNQRPSGYSSSSIYQVGAEDSQTEAYGYYGTFSISSTYKGSTIFFSYTPTIRLSNGSGYILKVFDNDDELVYSKKIDYRSTDSIEMPEQEVVVDIGENERTIWPSKGKEYIVLPSTLWEGTYKIALYSTIPGNLMNISSPKVNYVKSYNGNTYSRLYLVTAEEGTNGGTALRLVSLKNDSNSLPSNLTCYYI